MRISLALVITASMALARMWPAYGASPAPRAVQGVIDCTGVDFTGMDMVKLDGQWEFYWGRLLQPGDLKTSPSSPAGYGEVPLFWTHYGNGRLPSKGQATYRLRVSLKSPGMVLSLKTPELFSEHRLWIDGKIVDAHGAFAGGPVRFLKPDVFTFQAVTDSVDIVIEMRNRSHGNAGIGQSFTLGRPEAVARTHMASVIMEIILTAVCVFAGIYHTSMFAFRRKEKDLLYFGLFCLVIALRTMSTGNTYMMQLFPHMPFEVGSRIATAVIPLSVMAFLLFSYHFFIEIMPRRVMLGILGANTAYLALVFTTSTFFYASAFNWYLLLVLATFLFVFGVAVASIVRGNRYALIYLLGFSFLFLGAANDMLHYKQLINTGYYLALFFSAFIMAQTILLSIRFANEHRIVEEVSERLKKIDRLKDDFLANTSHELRTPLNGIIGISESLLDGAAGPLTGGVRANVELIVSSGKRLSSLINDILDYSKLRNRDIEIVKKSVDMRPLVSVVMTVIRATMPDSDVALHNDIPNDFPPVLGDETRLQQIMYNLIGNAFKFTRKGSVRVSASLKGDRIEIAVRDTGIGIPTGKLNDIFTSFEQVDGSISREYGGTGLGLSITKKLVELHGGMITVESEEGAGSTFRFTLQKAEGAEPSLRDEVIPAFPGGAVVKAGSGSEAPHSDEGDRGESAGRILLVDDEKVNIQVLTNFLATRSYSSDPAFNGIEAIEMSENETYDMVLLDIMMPRMSGYDVCRKLREKYSAFELPILMLTAKGQCDDIVTAFNLGANDYIVKPFDRNELMARIETHMSLKKAVRRAIENARLANTDSLTGLYNRRYFWNVGEIEFAAARKKEGLLAVMMLDIDDFKAVNDTFGHDAGDMVIRHLASLIRDNTRGRDISGRYGGEEFIVILPDTDAAGAVYVAEKIRGAAEASRPCFEQSGSISFTVSTGVASIDEGMQAFEELTRRADEMLYRAKRSGKNRVEA